VPRDGVVAYLERYAEDHRLDVRLETEVTRIERSDGGWSLATSNGEHQAARVVVATGYNRRPAVPEWPGRERYPGQLIHASSYREPSPYRGKVVLVVGAGNSGAEIAVDLVEGGAARVLLSVRTPPYVFPRQALGVPTQAIGICLGRLPVRAGDVVAATLQRILVGDLSRYGMPKAPTRFHSDFLVHDVIPILDVGLIGLLKRGAVDVVPAVEAFDDDGAVVLADGARIRPDAVIAATGYRRDLEPLVGHLGLLGAKGRPSVHGAATHPAAPGLYFIGFTNPISGNLRELGFQARGIARAVSASFSRK
jgi:putative flavoprotein involved in K+ transport